MKTRIGILALVVLLVGCGDAAKQDIAPTVAPLTITNHFIVSANLVRRSGATFDITYDHTAFSDGSITVTGTVSGVTPGSNTRSFRIGDGWNGADPAFASTATEQWTIAIDAIHAGHIVITRQPLGHKDSSGAFVIPDGEGWYVPIGGNTADLTQIFGST